MLVDEPGTSSNLVVESPWPLVTPDDQGALAPTDMTLEQLVSGGWSPANSPVQDLIGQDLGAGVKLGSGADTLTVRPGGAPNAAGLRSANKVFYANTDTDVDTIVEPMPTGVGINWTLRSPLASERTSMTFDLPAGVTLRASGTTVDLVQAGHVVGMVSPPLAWDAQNTQVPVRYDVAGSTITVTTSHHGRDLAYPVSVDPVVHWSADPNSPVVALDPGGYPGPTYTGGNWSYAAASGYDPYFGHGFISGRFFISAAGTLPNGSAAWMVGRGNAFLTRVDFPDIRFTAAQNVCMAAGLWNWASGNPAGETGYAGIPNGPAAAGMFGNCTGFGQTYVTACASSVCDPAVGTTGNSAGVQLFVAASPSGANSSVSFTGAYLFWNDHDLPTVSVSGLPGGWSANNQPTAIVQLHDNGLGIGTDTAYGDHRELAQGTVDNDSTVRTAQIDQHQSACAGTFSSACWADGDATIMFGALPDGVRTLHFFGRDILNNVTRTDRTVYIDTTAPKITTTGRLADLGRSTSGSEPSRSVSKTVHMTAIASDASPAVSTSGLGTYGLTITQPGHATGSVTTHTVLSDGSWKIDYDFVPSSWNQGPVTFTLTSADAVGNVATNTFTVNVARGDITTLIEGQKTAKRLVLQAEDLKPASPASSVVFQYRTKATTWQSIPAANLQAIDGSSITNNSFAVSSSTHRSPQVVYNVTDQLNAAQVYVRGYFSSAAGDTTDDVLTGIDTTGVNTSDSMHDIGPGQVDELTGNFQLTDSDIDIDSFKEDLGITRTYNSRNPGTIFGGTQPFGPGWTLGMPVDDDASAFTKVIDYNASSDPDLTFLGAAEVDTSDGDALPFEEHNTDNGYNSLPELDGLHLERKVDAASGATTGFTLKDRDNGQTLVFAKATGNPGEWALSSVEESTSTVATTFRYTPDASGRQKLTAIIAPSPVDCSGTNFMTTAGCRSLVLNWNSGFTRVMSIDFVAPGNGLTGNKVAVAAYTYNSDNRLSSADDPRPGAPGPTTYTYDSNGRLSTITPPGENAWTLAYTQGPGELSTVGRLSSVSRSQPVGTAGTPTTAKQVIFYNMAVRGSGAFYDMSASALAGWGQVDDIPTDAAAIFRPDDVPGNPPSSSDYATATFHYLDALGRLTNEVRPGGETTTTEHDAAGNITRELSAANRATALATGSTAAAHAARAQELSTIRTFGERTQGSGWRLLDEKGPLHSTRLSTGATVQAREHIVKFYDDSDPDSESLNFPIKTVQSAYTPGTGDADSRTQTMSYNSAGLQTSMTVDPLGLNLTSRTEYNSLGLVTFQEAPRSASQTAATTRRTIYYTVGANGDDTACANKPAWANLPCKIKPGGQPAGTPKLPGSVYEYDAYEHQTKKSDWVDGVLTRTQTDAYNGDLHTSQTVTGSAGDAVPDVTYGYSPTTGRLLTTTSSNPTRTVTRVYNGAGQISSYTDADGGTTTTAYDIDGRPTTVTDPSGTRTIAYDPTSGRTTSITEPQLGAISTAWTADGDLSSEVFPSANVKLTVSRDETRTVTGRTYVAQAPCSVGCTIYSDTAARSIHDEWLTETGTDTTRINSYDAAGRLTSSSDAPGGTSCVTKTYTYDLDSNRAARKTYPPGSGGACSTTTTPTTQTLTYDEADRLVNPGYAYDDLGRITTVPAADAGGISALTPTYYVDDHAHTLTQGGTTTTLDLDPLDRVRQRTVGSGTPTVSHYGDETDEPAWTTQGGTTLRYSEDADGDVVATVRPSGGGSSSWSAPTTSVLDNFNRADGSLGANWSNLGPSAAAITSNQARINGSSYGYAWWNANSYTGAGEVYVTAQTASVNTGDQLYLDIVSGWSSGSLNGYEVSLTRGATNDTIEFSKYANGSETSLGAAQTMTGHIGAGDKVALTREAGGLLKAWRSASGSSTWTQIGTTVTNATYFEAGQAWQVGWGASNSGYRVDDVGGGQSTVGTSSTTKLEISDLHGDVVSEVPNTSGAAASILSPVDAFGAPVTSAGANVGLGYLGAKQRNTALSTGTVEMGARLYQPQIGRFLQPDPVYGGSLNTYDYANQDPVNDDDLSGLAGAMGHCTKGTPGYRPAKCKKFGYKPREKSKSNGVKPGFKVAAGLACSLVVRLPVAAQAACGYIGTVGAVSEIPRGKQKRGCPYPNRGRYRHVHRQKCS